MRVLIVGERSGFVRLVVGTRYLKQVNLILKQVKLQQGGESIPRLAWLAAKRGWKGLDGQSAYRAPWRGVVMNAGAHRGCTADIR